MAASSGLSPSAAFEVPPPNAPGSGAGGSDARAEAAAQAADGANAIAALLVREDLVSAERLAYARRVHAKLPSQRTLLSVLLALQYVNEGQVKETLRKNRIDVPLGAMLVELGAIRPADLAAALAIQAEGSKRRLGEILVENHFISEEALYDVLSSQLGFPYVEPDLVEIEDQVARRAAPKYYQTHEFIVVREQDGQVLVAFSDPLDEKQLQAARKIFGDAITPAIARRQAIHDAAARLESSSRRAPTASASDSAVVATVNEILEHAARTGTSDVHVEPMADRLRVRFRQDGELLPFKDFRQEMAPAIVSRIKILAGADIAEKRRHQDGRILFEQNGLSLDMRVSFYVTIHGEKVVLRLLNNRSQLLELADLGMAPRMGRLFREDVLEAPSGVVIITGPTGSGKTTTLYSGINYLKDPSTSIITAEDPVEYMIDGISQCSINPKINITYEETLRHIVRQDPDIVVIGEIRDKFSAEIAVQAALTGHKVLTTFHTEDAVGGLLRLLYMDVEPFLIASSVICVLAQRLVRRVCASCAEDTALSPHELRRLGYNAAQMAGVSFKVGRGCSDCRYTGYRGRLAVHEMLLPNDPVRDAVLARKTSHGLRHAALQHTGMTTLLEDGIIKAARGETTLEEILQHLPRLERPRPVAELLRMQGDGA